MGDSSRPTTVADVAMPVELVALEHLRTKSGEPVQVQCEGVSELVLAEVFQSLPGGRPPMAGGGDDGEPDAVEQMRALNTYAPRIIEAGTVLVGPDGTEVRPAFYFGEKSHPLSIPGRLLREGDKVRMLTAIMRLGGYGGAATAEVFREDGAGAGDGVGTVAAGDGAEGATAQANGNLPIEA